MGNIMNKRAGLFAKNIIFAVGANVSRIFTTLILTLILPKVMSVEAYSEWQLYHFYATYLVYSTLGWTEGLYMKYGGISYQDLDKRRISSQIWGIAVHEAIFACIALFTGGILLSAGDIKRQLLLGAVLYMVFHVILCQLQAVLQACNRISDYARLYTGERVLFLSAALGCILIGQTGFHGFILVEILSNVILMAYAAYLCREIVFARPLPFKTMLKEERELIGIGCSVSLASFLGQLIIGVVRFGVEQKWGTVAFGQLSLSFSMANMAVTCITAVSIVIFPVLKRLNRDKANHLYLPIRDLMTMPMFGILLFYAPVKYLLTLWLPEYGDSVRYLAVLLPFCIFEVRNSVLACTYLKVWMGQKYIMYANIAALAVSAAATWLTVFVLESMDLAAVSIMGLYALKTILTEQAVKKYINIKLALFNIQELLLTTVFMLLSWFCSPLSALSGYLICYLLYLYFGRKRLSEAYSTLKGMIR